MYEYRQTDTTCIQCGTHLGSPQLCNKDNQCSSIKYWSDKINWFFCEARAFVKNWGTLHSIVIWCPVVLPLYSPKVFKLCAFFQGTCQCHSSSISNLVFLKAVENKFQSPSLCILDQMPFLKYTLLILFFQFCSLLALFEYFPISYCTFLDVLCHI